MNMKVINTGLCLMLALALFVFVAAFLVLGFDIQISHRAASIVVFGGAIIGIGLLAIAVVSDIVSERANNRKQSR